MSIIVCNCQHCDEEQFQTLSCVHYTIFSVVKLDLFIRALLLEKNYAYASGTSCYTSVKLWNFLLYTTQLITNKQAFKSEFKKNIMVKTYLN